MNEFHDDQAAADRWLAWRQARQAELSGPDSWLGLVGLFWLTPGLNAVGSATDAKVRLPGGPPRLGNLLWAGGRVIWQPATGEACELQTDLAGAPTPVTFEHLVFFIVDREGQLAARVRDRDWSAKQPFVGLDYFPHDPAWEIAADWQSLSPPLCLEVPNVSGELKSVEVVHQAVFTLAGQVIRLLPVSESENEVFFVFRDLSSGKATYGAGRFLKAQAAVNGRLSLDFNRAYNPPCAFTPFATCPLPPPENWLPVAVPAGEKMPAAGH